MLDIVSSIALCVWTNEPLASKELHSSNQLTAQHDGASEKTDADMCKGAPPITADPGGIPDFRIFNFSENVDL